MIGHNEVPDSKFALPDSGSTVDDLCRNRGPRRQRGSPQPDERDHEAPDELHEAVAKRHALRGRNPDEGHVGFDLRLDILLAPLKYARRLIRL